MLCEPNDTGYSCDFSKNSQSAGFCTIHIGLYVTQYREYYIYISVYWATKAIAQLICLSPLKPANLRLHYDASQKLETAIRG